VQKIDSFKVIRYTVILSSELVIRHQRQTASLTVCQTREL